MTQPHLSVAVTLVPRSHMTQPEANSVQGQIQKAILAICLRKPAQGTTPYAPSFVGQAFLNEGVLKLWCYDDKALSWLQEIIPRLKSPRKGTGLTVIRQADIPVRIRSALYVPDFTEEIAILQQKRSIQNPWYKVSSWTLYTFKRTNSNPPGDFPVLGIPTEKKRTKEPQRNPGKGKESLILHRIHLYSVLRRRRTQ
ncbi:jg17857 [Pararge aegeria aegeria]|uniref:Jg17857 protein n=1 Tax=Pararge aegeria aegeria TaxID=348720 RepID=A0A8S4QCB7_9NEOP|nr:jg17857 [Pararge aegeria aegeria]